MHEGRIKRAMTMPTSRRHVLIGAGLLGTAALARGMVPTHNFDLLGKGKLEAMVPNEIGPWRFASKSGLVIPPQDQLADQLYDQLLTRVYTADGRPPMMLLIAQSPGQDGVLQIHRPEFCYPAGGFALTEGGVHVIRTPDGRGIPTRVFTATGIDRTEQLAYWTRIGRDLPTSWAQQRWSVAKANLRGEIPDAVMVRISTVSSDPTVIAQIDLFARQMLASVASKNRAVLIGSAAA